MGKVRILLVSPTPPQRRVGLSIYVRKFANFLTENGYALGSHHSWGYKLETISAGRIAANKIRSQIIQGTLSVQFTGSSNFKLED